MSDFGEKVQRNYLKEVHQHCDRITGIANEMYARGEGFRGRCLEHEKESDEMLRHLDETATTVEDISEGSPPRKDMLDPSQIRRERQRPTSLEPSRVYSAVNLIERAESLEREAKELRRNADNLKDAKTASLV